MSMGSGANGSNRAVLKIESFSLTHREEPSIANLVEERTIADFQCLSRLAAIPVVNLQRPQNDVLLQFASCFFGNSLERDWTVFILINRDGTRPRLTEISF